MAMSFAAPTPVRTICYQTNNSTNPSSVTFRFLHKTYTYSRGPNCVQCNSAFRNGVSRNSAANHVTLRTGVRRIAWKTLAVKQVSERRQVTLTIRCATIEEIQAEKAAVENYVKQRMDKTIESVKSKFNSIRTGRAAPSMLDRVEVEYYGSPVSLKSIAQISTPDSSSLVVQPYDKSSLKTIEKALVASDLGLTPNNDGEVIRLSVPPLTSDRRKELSKVVAKQAEEGKVALRNIRRDGIKAYQKLEKDKKLSEDIVRDLTNDLQKVTDEYIKKIDSIFKEKEKEVLTV
ncbi:hypothetical protein RHGRI_002950 [Rhododendron griersonianum]|uniref:Ribosome-recycling factor, chloroplastic n=1 Tax=Rhododendron griersonianum TaxID=479676 RepID=A0AAV6LR00_9ERIC|nr:hypothetical protein RHGRI_002950 [Rhododendron griersonianum]